MDASVEKTFGYLPDGGIVKSYTLTNINGMQITVIDYGATITSLKIPVKNGSIEDVVLGFDTITAYMESINLPAPPYFGAAIGRWAGRIREGVFHLDGKIYQLEKNSNGHSLHGGRFGLSQVMWKIQALFKENNPSISFSYVSPDGEENFPGNLNVDVTYTLSEENELIVDFWAKSDQDTILNLTQHSYFNLDGHKADIKNQELWINANKLLETKRMIPTGNFLNVEDTPFDFKMPRKCPLNIDTTFILEETTGPCASLFSKKNKLLMNVFTDQPAIHIYVGGDCFNIISGKENAQYHELSGICFETQNFPDAPNHPNFPNAFLRKGEAYAHRTIYQFQNNEATN